MTALTWWEVCIKYAFIVFNFIFWVSHIFKNWMRLLSNNFMCFWNEFKLILCIYFFFFFTKHWIIITKGIEYYCMCGQYGWECFTITMPAQRREPKWIVGYVFKSWMNWIWKMLFNLQILGLCFLTTFTLPLYLCSRLSIVIVSVLVHDTLPVYSSAEILLYFTILSCCPPV